MVKTQPHYITRINKQLEQNQFKRKSNAIWDLHFVPEYTLTNSKITSCPHKLHVSSSWYTMTSFCRNKRIYIITFSLLHISSFSLLHKVSSVNIYHFNP